MPKPSTRLKTHTAPEARYVNYFEVGHNALEFIVDLGQYHPEQIAVQLQMRVVTAPVYAKLLSRMLMEAIERHEREHGVIQLEPSPARSDVTTTKMRSFEGAIFDG
jgi:Protein of unknown function (DUF3467)